MGGLMGGNQQKKTNVIKINPLLGKTSRCSACGNIFSSNSTIIAFNNHIKTCQQINKERVRIETLLKDLRDTSYQIEYLEKHLNKKSENKNIIKKEKFKKEKRKINNIVNEPSDLIQINQEIKKEKDSKKNHIFDNNFNDDIEEFDIIDFDPESIKKNTFEDKIQFFKHYVKNLKVDWREGSCSLDLDRDDFFRQSMFQFEKIDPYKELKINFRGEVSHDAGGLIREWYSIVFKFIQSSEIKLFEKSDTDEFSYIFSRNINPSMEILDIMYFLGKIMAKALLDNLTVNACFNKIIYKMILLEKITLEDLVFIDKQLYNSLKELKKMDKIDDLGIFFNLENENNGKIISDDLIPNGSTIAVTKKNLDNYISKRIEYMQIKAKNFINEIRNGIFQILPERLIKIFNSDEFELFLNGQPFIDLEDMRLNTIYKGFNSSDPIITNFWNILSNLSQKDLGILLQFCTGSSRVPIGGFSVLESNRGNISKFCITKSTWNPGKNYIRAHTCFNRLDLPDFKNEIELEEALAYIVKNEILGFGIE